MKLNITLNDELVKRLDAYAERNYQSRSGLIAQSCTQFLNAQELTLAITDLSFAVKKIADKGEIDEDTRKQIEDFERVVKLLNSNR